MTLDASELCRQPLALSGHALCGRPRLERGWRRVLARSQTAALLAHPIDKFILAYGDDLATQQGMIGAAEFGAVDRKRSGLGRLEPSLGVAVGQHVLLDPKRWHVERVDDVP